MIDSPAPRHSVNHYSVNQYKSSPLKVTLLGFLAVFLMVLSLSGCKRDERFQELGDKIASPVDIASHPNGTMFYVLNADFARDFNQGSILLLNSEGERVSTVKVPRLGRTLTVVGTDLLATFASLGEDGFGRVLIFDISNPSSPVLKKDLETPGCSPINAHLRENYRFFSVACDNGQLWVGELASNRAESTIRKVRTYSTVRRDKIVRRAMYIDPTRELLLMFPTNWNDQSSRDFEADDKLSITDDDLATQTDVPNEVPDDYELTSADRKAKTRRNVYQMVVYDLAQESSKGFPYEEDILKQQSEFRWIYFDLLNADGTPEIAREAGSTIKYYRTNFWDVRPDVTSPNSFFLSHRGGAVVRDQPGSPNANSIIKVTIKGDLKARSDGTFSQTKDTFAFDRVYGFASEVDQSRHFPGDFEVLDLQGSLTFVVNHFKDILNFSGSKAVSSLASKILGDNNWLSEIKSTDTGNDYFQIALTPQGRGAAVSFYQNSVILLDVRPGVAITEYKTIK